MKKLRNNKKLTKEEIQEKLEIKTKNKNNKEKTE